MNPFWVASSDEEDDDDGVHEDENNNNGSAEAASQPKTQEVTNPLQHIAFAYGSSDDDDQFIEGSGEEKEPVGISNNSREESAVPLVNHGNRNENDDSNADDEGDDHSFMTISTPEDSSDEDACDEYDSDESESNNDEKYHDLVPVTRSRYAAMPMLPNLARDRDCVLKISKERFVVIKDFEGGVVEISSSDEDEEVIKHGRLDANARSKNYY